VKKRIIIFLDIDGAIIVGWKKTKQVGIKEKNINILKSQING
jgi:hypothetical protein